MKKTSLFFTAIAIASVSFFASCSKDGAAGATGPQGAQGTQGVAGATGPTGPSNIVDSNFTVTTWTNSGPYYDVTISDPQITATIISKGVVVIAWSANGGTSWDGLPWTSENPTGYELNYQTNLGTVAFYWSGGSPASLGITTSTFRIECIPASIIAKHPNTNWNDYSQVKAIQNGMRSSN
ncbi:MAG TPA: collagen-like protein [Bacteroidia bacterium]|nr:collagen-like protein [Bacteroidia bacterium]